MLSHAWRLTSSSLTIPGRFGFAMDATAQPNAIRAEPSQTATFTARIPRAMNQKLSAKAREAGVSKSDVVRLALVAYLGEGKAAG